MSWSSSLGVVVVAAAVGAIAAAFASDLVLKLGWARVSAADGNHSLFMLLNMVYGVIGGVVIGLVVALLVPAGFAFWHAAGTAGLAVVAVVAAVVGFARQADDSAPMTDLGGLLVVAEVRWPEGTAERPRAATGIEPRLVLTATAAMGFARSTEFGKLWLDEAELDRDRWTATGAVTLSSSRRIRSLEVRIDDRPLARFDLPLPASPAADDFGWSDWYAPPSVDGFEYRFRLARPEDPARTITHGNFEISVRAEQYLPNVDRKLLPVVLRYVGEPVSAVSASTADGGSRSHLSEVRGAMPIAGHDAIVVMDDAYRGHLLVGDGAAVRAIPLTEVDLNRGIFEITSDPDRYRYYGFSFHADPLVIGALEQDRLYLLPGTTLHTGTLAVRAIPSTEGIGSVPHTAPLGLSPDGRSFVLRAHREGDTIDHLLAVVDLEGAAPYAVPVPVSERYSMDNADPRWLSSEYEWVVEAGSWRLVARMPARIK